MLRAVSSQRLAGGPPVEGAATPTPAGNGNGGTGAATPVGTPAAEAAAVAAAAAAAVEAALVEARLGGAHGLPTSPRHLHEEGSHAVLMSGSDEEEDRAVMMARVPSKAELAVKGSAEYQAGGWAGGCAVSRGSFCSVLPCILLLYVLFRFVFCFFPPLTVSCAELAGVGSEAGGSACSFRSALLSCAAACRVTPATSAFIPLPPPPTLAAVSNVSFTVQMMVQALTGGEGPGLAPWLARMLRPLLRLQARKGGLPFGCMCVWLVVGGRLARANSQPSSTPDLCSGKHPPFLPLSQEVIPSELQFVAMEARKALVCFKYLPLPAHLVPDVLTTLEQAGGTWLACVGWRCGDCPCPPGCFFK